MKLSVRCSPPRRSISHHTVNCSKPAVAQMDRLESWVREGVHSLLLSSTELVVAVVGVGWRILGEGVVLEGVCGVEKVGVSNE